MPLLLLFSAQVVAGEASPRGEPDVYWVPCDHATLAAALAQARNTSTDDEIRLTQDLLDRESIVGWDPGTEGQLEIVGGFIDCLASEPSYRTLLISGMDLLQVSGVTLRSLELWGTSSFEPALFVDQSNLDLVDVRLAVGFGSSGEVFRCQDLSAVSAVDSEAVGLLQQYGPFECSLWWSGGTLEGSLAWAGAEALVVDAIFSPVATEIEHGGFVILGGRIVISRSDIVSGDAPGSLFYAADGGEVVVESSRVWGNTAVSLFEADGGGTVNVFFVTAAANNGPGGRPLAAMARPGGAVQLYGSIFMDTDGPFFQTGHLSPAPRCLVVDTLDGFEHLAAEALHLTGDPGFVDPAMGNLRLRSDSVAVDFCDAPPFGVTPDVDGDPRGIDVAANPDGSPGVPGGTWDVGFDELALVFADGFETGDLSAWSS